ncbi:MAG: ABC transporter substrate-binding protein [Promethearchaeota archaeon]
MNDRDIKRQLNTILFSAILINVIIFNILSNIVMYEYDYDGWAPMPTLLVGTPNEPSTLDPTDSWDKYSNNVIEQVVETLFTYNLSDPEFPLVTLLAESYTWINATNLEITVKNNVFFHDGNIFDANAVKWNLDRLRYLMNHTGELSSDARVVKPHSLYEFPDGTPIFDKIIIKDPYTVEIHLVAPYSPILDVMCYISCGMLSPNSTPDTSIISFTNGALVGTGPYVFDSYISGQVTLLRYYNYWQGASDFERLIFSIINNPHTLNYAMLAGDIDYIIESAIDFLPSYRENSWITVYDVNSPGLAYNYLVFNNKRINVTWRKAMSYAINYTYIIKIMLYNNAFRSYGPISSSFGDAYNPSINETAPFYNLTHAREIIIDNISEAAGRDPLNDSHWGLGFNTLISFNYSYNVDDQFRTDLYPLLKNWFTNISINVIDGGTDWTNFDLRYNDYIPSSFNNLELFWMSWTPSFYDPVNVFFPLFSNTSQWNVAQVNDFKLEKMMVESLLEYNNSLRFEIYQNISHYLAEELYPHAFGFHSKIHIVHAADLYNVPYNPTGKFYAYPIIRNETWIPNF